MSVIIRRPWTRQPQVAPRIDWSNPITRGLRGLVWVGPGGTKDLVNPIIPFVSNGASAVATPVGMATTASVAVAYVDYSGNQTILAPWKIASTPMTVAAFCKDLVVGGSTAPFAAMDNGGYALTNRYGVNQRMVAIGSGNIDDGSYWDSGFHVRAATHDGATLRGYDSGRQYNAVANSSSSLTYDPTYSILSLLSYNGGTGLWMAAWDRALTPTELRSLEDNPWQLFAPLPRRIWAPSAGGAATVAGSIAATLLDVGVGASKSGAAASIAGSLSDSGVGASRVSAAGSIAGSLAVSGVGRGVTSAVGSISATAAVNGVGASSVSAAAEVDGVLVVGGVGASLGITSAVGSISASATVQGVGASTSSAVVSSSSVLAVDGVGASLGVTTAVGSISAAAAVDGVGATQASAVATSASVLSMAGVGSTGGVLVAADGAISASLVVSGLSASTVVAAGDIVASLSMADYVPTVSMRPEGRRKKRKTNQDDIDIMELAAIMAPVLCGNATCL